MAGSATFRAAELVFEKDIDLQGAVIIAEVD
jgi:hypothetical protein